MHFFGDIAFTTLALMVFAALCAGFIDAIAGGGGLIQLPAMLIGLPNSPTVQVLGTNKLSSIFGTSVAAHLYRRNIKPDFRITLAMAFPAFLGSMLGAQLASYIPTQGLRPLVFALLVGVAIFTWFKPDLGAIESLRHSAKKSRIIASIAGMLVVACGAISGGSTPSAPMSARYQSSVRRVISPIGTPVAALSAMMRSSISVMLRAYST